MRSLYFAYGLRLEEHTMVDRYPNARFYKFAVLRGFRLIFSCEEGRYGVCSIDTGTFNDSVEGVLYSLDTLDLEEPLKGSTRSCLDLLCDNGEYVSANVYFTNKKSLVAPQEDYLLRIYKKYQDYGFNTQTLENALDKSNYGEVE